MDNYKIAETEIFSKKITMRKYRHLYKKIFEDVYPVLRNNPFFGINIKNLKRDYREIYRFRIGNYRVFYKVNENELIIFIIELFKNFSF